MKRRDSLKTLIAGAAGGAVVMHGCKPAEEMAKEIPAGELYGRLPHEIKHDKKVKAMEFFSKSEMDTISQLVDIILPADDLGPSATTLNVPEFIEFIVNDIPSHQLPLRGGLMWLDSESNERFGKKFVAASKDQQLQIIEDIAYPNDVEPQYAQGAKFFTHIRDLAMTGYFTTEVGVRQVLGYKGNVPNVWDGVPEEVLAKHDVDYDPEWLAKCVDQDKRDVIAEWDDDMNLIT